MPGYALSSNGSSAVVNFNILVLEHDVLLRIPRTRVSRTHAFYTPGTRYGMIHASLVSYHTTY